MVDESNIYLRSALIKSQDCTIRLLNQTPNATTNNISYVAIRDAQYKQDVKYFDFDDFDKVDSGVIEGSDDDKPTISSDDNSENDSPIAHELSEKEKLELESIENVVNTISKDTKTRGTSYTNYIMIFIFGLICAYYARF